MPARKRKTIAVWGPVEIRAELGFNRSDWARILGVTLRTVERWEDEGTPPQGAVSEILRGIAEALALGTEPGTIARRINLGVGTLLAATLSERRRS